MPKKKRYPRKKRTEIHPSIAKAKRNQTQTRAEKKRQERLTELEHHAQSISRKQKARASDPFYDLNHQKTDEHAEQLTRAEMASRRCYSRPGRLHGWDKKPRRT